MTPKQLAIDWDDEIIKGVALTRDGAVVHPAFASADEGAPAEEPVVEDEPDTDEES